MPLDIVQDKLIKLDTNLDFKVAYEPTKMKDHKYVVREDTGEYMGIVGSGFKCASHPAFFDAIEDVIQDNREFRDLYGAEVKLRSARNNAWSLVDITLPNVSHTITTAKHQTVINERIIGLHAIDGSCSNQVHVGAIDRYCTNGQISGEYDTIRKKNTSGFNIETFIWELKNSKSTFDARQKYLQSMADTPLNVDGKTLLEKIIKSENLAKKMYELTCVEISKRGKNVFALYSAFTNYASYADERNGFALRNTGKDTVAQSMWAREQKVAQWVSSPEFKSLMAA
mgnify:CR=1 FL=1